MVTEERDEARFDKLVHEVLSMKASAINNEGPLAQVQFLLSTGLTLKDINDWEQAHGGK